MRDARATRRYVGIIEPGPHNWSISFPAVYGTVTTSKSIAELLGHAGDALEFVIDATQEVGKVFPDDVDAAPASFSYDPTSHQDPRIVLVPVEVHGKALEIDVTMDEGLLAQLDALAVRT